MKRYESGSESEKKRLGKDNKEKKGRKLQKRA